MIERSVPACLWFTLSIIQAATSYSTPALYTLYTLPLWITYIFVYHVIFPNQRWSSSNIEQHFRQIDETVITATKYENRLLERYIPARHIISFATLDCYLTKYKMCSSCRVMTHLQHVRLCHLLYKEIQSHPSSQTVRW